MSVYFCGGSCIEDVTTHLMYHLSLHPTLRTCSDDTILRAIKELTQDNISYTSDTGKTYDFNTADKLNTLLLNCLLSTGQLKISVPAKWVRTSRQYVLNIYSCNNAYADVFQNDFG